MRLTAPRGVIGERVHAHLLGRSRLDEQDVAEIGRQAAERTDVLDDIDVQATLAVLHELHHQGFVDVPDELEWDPVLVGVRVALERAVERALRAEIAPVLQELTERVGAESVSVQLRRLAADDDGPALASWVGRRATVEQYRELVRSRSLLHLKEADAQTWAIPRLRGAAKSALIEIQIDEYGRGQVGRMHSDLFARLMVALDLDPTYGTYWPEAHATDFAVVNAMTMFGFNRRLRGWSVGQFAMTELTSCAPNAALGAGLRRLGFDPDATWFYDEHVEADAVHEQLATVDLAGNLVADQPRLQRDVLSGAAAYLALEKRFATRLLERWTAPGRPRTAITKSFKTSLRAERPAPIS